MLYRQVVRFCCGLLLFLLTCPSLDTQVIAPQVDPNAKSQPLAPPLRAPGTGADPKQSVQASKLSGSATKLSGASQNDPPANGAPPVDASYVDKEFQKLTSLWSNPGNKDQIAALRLLLALSEYMIYGKHEMVDCHKLVQWLWLRSNVMATPFADISGTIWKNFYAKFTSTTFSGFFQGKSTISEWKAHLPDDFFAGFPFGVEDIEDATVLEIAHRLPHLIDRDLGLKATYVHGELLYMISVWPTYLAIVEDILGDNSTEGEGEGMLGKVLPAWAKKHPKYSGGAGSVVGFLGLSGISALIRKYFKAPANDSQVTSPSSWNQSTPEKASHPPVTIEVNLVADGQLFFALASFIGGVTVFGCVYYHYVYLGNRDHRLEDNRQEAKPTGKRSQRKSNKTAKSHKTTPSSKSRKSSPPTTGQTST